MPKKETIEFKVGEEGYISLEGLVLSPHLSKPEATIYFLEGLGGDFRDYMCLLEPLADEFKVVAHNYRGHSGSQGYFHPADCANDLLDIVNTEEGKVHLLGHSIGSMISINSASKKPEKFSSNYMIAPFSDVIFLPDRLKKSVKLLNAFEGALPFIDKVLYKTGISKKRGHCNHVLQAHSKIDKDGIRNHYQRYNQGNIPTAFVLTRNDEVLGTADEHHYNKINDLLLFYIPKIENRSALFQGLNHELNLEGSCPFLKPELYRKTGNKKDTKKLIENIAEFYRKHK